MNSEQVRYYPFLIYYFIFYYKIQFTLYFNVTAFTVVHSWKLSKTTTLNEDAQAQINVKLDEIQVLKQKYYVERKHTEDDCFYYPNNDGGPVLLGGQCISDAQVPAVTGFISSKVGNMFLTWNSNQTFNLIVRLFETILYLYLRTFQPSARLIYTFRLSLTKLLVATIYLTLKYFTHRNSGVYMVLSFFL